MNKRAWWSRCLRAFVGDISWDPPQWLKCCAWPLLACLRIIGRHPKAAFASLIIVAGLSIGGMQWWNWWQSHKPRELSHNAVRQVEVSVSAAPASVDPGSADQNLKPSPLRISFSGAQVAPLEQIGKDATAAVELSPGLPGNWSWMDGSTLEFQPQGHWPPATPLTVTLHPTAMAEDIELDTTTVETTTPPLVARIRDHSFYNSPKDPAVYQVVATLELSHPVTQATLQEQLRMQVIGGSSLFVPGDPRFTLSPDPESVRRFFIRSRQIVVPKKEDWVKLVVPAGIASTLGGKALADGVEAKTRVPDRFSGLTIDSVETRIIRTDEGEPQQFLFVHTNRVIDSAQIAERIQMWWHRNGWYDKHGKLLFDQHLASATPVGLELVESAAPLSKQHAFRFTEPRTYGRLFLRIDAGVTSPGGFETPTRFDNSPRVPAFPKETRLLGNGNILALHGERKLVVQSRGVDHLRITLARVPDSKFHQLVTATGSSSFDDPQFYRNFSENDLIQRWSRIVAVPRDNDWQATRSVIDVAEAPPLTTPESLAGGRGVFFVTVEPVQETKPSPAIDDVHSRIDSPSPDKGGGTPHEVWYPYEQHSPDDGWSSSGGNESKRFLMVTDLGLLVKAAADGSRDVFVMSIANGKPVWRADVRVLARNGSVLESVKTGLDGHARLQPFDGLTGERLPVAVVVSKGDDASLLPFNEHQLPAMDYSRFDIDGMVASRIKEVESFVFTERGVYRPGDTVHVGFITRRHDWQPVLDGLPLRVSIHDPRGRTIDHHDTRLSHDGFLACDFELPDGASLGVHQIEVEVLSRSGKHPMFRLGRTAVRVEEFQPERMKVATRILPDPPTGWLDTSVTTARAEVMSLFGEAAPDRRVTMKLELSPAHFGFDQWPGFTFHDPSTASSKSRAGRTIELGETMTNAEGIAEFKLPLDTIGDASFRLSILTEAFERSGGRSVRHGMTTFVSAYNEVVGWKADGALDTIPVDGGRQVSIIAVDRHLQPVALDNLRQRLVEIRQISALTKLRNGNYAYVSTSKESKLEEKPVTLTAELGTWDLPTSHAGRFRMELVDADGLVRCAIPFAVVGKGDAYAAIERESELSLQLSKTEVLPGEEIEVFLTAPYAGAGLVTIERDKVYQAQWFRSDSKTASVKVKVPQDIEGTFYINAAFIRDTSQPEVFHSPLSYAAAPIRVLAPEKQLTLQLDAPREVKPGFETRFSIRSDRPARAIVYAVDEGIHRITNYQRPDPLGFFLRKQALEVRTQQWLDLLLPEYRFLKSAPAFGGGGDGGLDDSPLNLHLNPFKRSKEPPVVFWSGIIETGPESRDVSWLVPDYFNGNLRVMAVACNPGAMASAAAETLVKAPIILQPNTPLFVSPGDEFEASLTVFNDLESPGSSTISIGAACSKHLEPVGDAQQSITLDQGRETVVHFRFRALDQLGGAEIRFEASGGGETIHRSTTLSVRPASHHLTDVVTGWFRTGSTEQKVKRTLYPQFRSTHATASITPLGLASGLEAYVHSYPYGCSEQITSKAMVKLVAATDADFGLSAKETTSAIRTAMLMLQSRQRSDGGFGYWQAGANDPFEFHSLYALHFLTEATLAGHAVPERMLKSALNYATSTARAKTRNLHDAQLQAYAIYLLARNESNPTPQLLNLRDTLEKSYKGKWESQSTAAWLAASYMLVKKQKEADELLDACLAARASGAVASAPWDYHATPTIEALKVFYIQCRHFPKRAKSFGIEQLEPVMKPLRDQSFNTLAASYMTLALKAYSDLARSTGVEVSILAIVRGSDAPTRLAGPSAGTIRSDFGPDTSALRFERKQNGDGDIGAFYQVVEQGYDSGTPTGPLRSGLEVVRELTPSDADKPLRPGDPVDVVLRVRNVSGRDLDNLAVIDLLPAGFEVITGELSSGAGTVPGTGYAELREDRNLFFLGLKANAEWSLSYRIKAVCAGAFTVPTAMAEDMYDRGLHGVSTPGRIEITPAR